MTNTTITSEEPIIPATSEEPLAPAKKKRKSRTKRRVAEGFALLALIAIVLVEPWLLIPVLIAAAMWL